MGCFELILIFKYFFYGNILLNLYLNRKIKILICDFIVVNWILLKYSLKNLMMKEIIIYFYDELLNKYLILLYICIYNIYKFYK